MIHCCSLVLKEKQILCVWGYIEFFCSKEKNHRPFITEDKTVHQIVIILFCTNKKHLHKLGILSNNTKQHSDLKYVSVHKQRHERRQLLMKHLALEALDSNCTRSEDPHSHPIKTLVEDNLDLCYKLALISSLPPGYVPCIHHENELL